MLSLLPATVSPDRIALVGLHEWTDDDYPNVAEWGLRSFRPDELRESAVTLVDWLASTQCSRVAIHLDVDTIDSNEIVLGLGAVRGGLKLRDADPSVCEGRCVQRNACHRDNQADGAAPVKQPLS